MSSTDHPVPGHDEAGGEPDAGAAGSSRARVRRYGVWPWVGGVVLAAVQVVVVAMGSGGWRMFGVGMLVGVTVVGVGFAGFGGGGSE